MPGFSVFYRNEAGEIFHTYSSYARGGDLLIGAYNFLDMTPKGRNEEEIMDWMRHHDRYEEKPLRRLRCSPRRRWPPAAGERRSHPATELSRSPTTLPAS